MPIRWSASCSPSAHFLSAKLRAHAGLSERENNELDHNEPIGRGSRARVDMCVYTRASLVIIGSPLWPADAFAR